MISKEELYEGYKEIYGKQMTEDELLKEVDNIMEKLDIDKSGQVDYTEWAVGTINK
jgi:Ca2+-binding EF-hand superfamily protein